MHLRAQEGKPTQETNSAENLEIRHKKILLVYVGRIIKLRLIHNKIIRVHEYQNKKKTHEKK